MANPQSASLLKSSTDDSVHGSDNQSDDSDKSQIHGSDNQIDDSDKSQIHGSDNQIDDSDKSQIDDSDKSHSVDLIAVTDREIGTSALLTGTLASLDTPNRKSNAPSSVLMNSLSATVAALDTPVRASFKGTLASLDTPNRSSINRSNDYEPDIDNAQLAESESNRSLSSRKKKSKKKRIIEEKSDSCTESEDLTIPNRKFKGKGKEKELQDDIAAEDLTIPNRKFKEKGKEKELQDDVATEDLTIPNRKFKGKGKEKELQDHIAPENVSPKKVNRSRRTTPYRPTERANENHHYNARMCAIQYELKMIKLAHPTFEYWCLFRKDNNTSTRIEVSDLLLQPVNSSTFSKEFVENSITKYQSQGHPRFQEPEVGQPKPKANRSRIVSYKDRFELRTTSSSLEELYTKFCDNHFINATVRRVLWSHWRKDSRYHKEMENGILEMHPTATHPYDHINFKILFEKDAQIPTDVLFHRLNGVLYEDHVNRTCFLNVLLVLDDMATIRNESPLPRYAPSFDDDCIPPGVTPTSHYVTQVPGPISQTLEDSYPAQSLEESKDDPYSDHEKLPIEWEELNARLEILYGKNASVNYIPHSTLNHLNQLLDVLLDCEIPFLINLWILKLVKCIEIEDCDLKNVILSRSENIEVGVETVDTFVPVAKNFVLIAKKAIQENSYDKSNTILPIKVTQNMIRAPLKYAQELKKVGMGAISSPKMSANLRAALSTPKGKTFSSRPIVIASDSNDESPECFEHDLEEGSSNQVYQNNTIPDEVQVLSSSKQAHEISNGLNTKLNDIFTNLKRKNNRTKNVQARKRRKPITANREDVVERILEMEELSGTLQFLVKWEGYDEGENTYQSLRSLSNCKQLLNDFFRFKVFPYDDQMTVAFPYKEDLKKYVSAKYLKFKDIHARKKTQEIVDLSESEEDDTT